MWGPKSKWNLPRPSRTPAKNQESQGSGSSSAILIPTPAPAPAVQPPTSTSTSSLNMPRPLMESIETPASSAAQKLPVELMLEIFSYLDFGDRREARRVCQRWKSVLSDWNGFTDDACFLLRRSPSSNTYSILNSSRVPWKNIRLNRFVAAKPPNWYFPEYLNDTLTSLTFQDGTFKWCWFKSVVSRFHRLENLGIANCARIVEEDEGWEQTEQQFNGFLALRRRLKVLTIELGRQDSYFLLFYLKQFTDAASSLEELNISCDFTPRSRLDQLDQLAGGIMNLVTCCNSSLTSIKLQGDLQFVNTICSSLESLHTKGVQLNLSTFHLQLNKSASEAGHSLNPTETHRAYSTIINNLIRSQPNLKSLAIPRIKDTIPRWEFSIYCPRNLEEFRTSQMSLIVPELFQLFKKLKKINLAFSDAPFPDNFVESIGGRVYPEMKAITISGFPNGNLMVPVIVAFPNLVKLVVSCVNDASRRFMINDENLQMIIQSLHSLRVLKLKSCTGITDAGVSGIRVSDAQSILNSRSLYLEKDLSVFGIIRSGLPLSSLKYLKECSLVNSNEPSALSEISDVGIYYGLGFNNLRRLYLNCGQHVSDWGIVQLGRLNPSLEHCFVKTDSTITTKGARLLLEQSLPRAKQHYNLDAAIGRLAFAGR